MADLKLLETELKLRGYTPATLGAYLIHNKSEKLDDNYYYYGDTIDQSYDKYVFRDLPPSIQAIKTTLKTLVGYFINPVPGYKRISQRLHGNNGVDLAAPTGTEIVASASGTVLLARNGYNGGYGNMVIIKHPNGTQTLYAHQSKITTSTGDRVSQGQTIGYVGSTGRSTGPHLHYEIHGARNNALDL